MSNDKAKPAAERRHFGRREATLHALMVTGGRAPVHCIVHNYSTGGALLEFQERFVPPFRFRLVIKSKHVDVLCEVRHQRQSCVGVSFVGVSNQGLFEAIPPAASGATPPVEREPPKPPSRTSGTDLRNALFGVNQREHASEPVRRFESGNGGYSRKF